MDRIHEGWLVKSPPEKNTQGPLKWFKSKWRRRYFVLYGMRASDFSLSMSVAECSSALLCYYNDDQLTREHGRIDLKQCQEIHTQLQTDAYQHVFAVKTLHNDMERTYCLAADTHQAMVEWEKSLNSVLCLFDSGFDQLPPWNNADASSQTINTLPCLPKGFSVSRLPGRKLSKVPPIITRSATEIHLKVANNTPGKLRAKQEKNSSKPMANTMSKSKLRMSLTSLAQMVGSARRPSCPMIVLNSFHDVEHEGDDSTLTRNNKTRPIDCLTPKIRRNKDGGYFSTIPMFRTSEVDQSGDNNSESSSLSGDDKLSISPKSADWCREKASPPNIRKHRWGETLIVGSGVSLNSSEGRYDGYSLYPGPPIPPRLFERSMSSGNCLQMTGRDSFRTDKGSRGADLLPPLHLDKVNIEEMSEMSENEDSSPISNFSFGIFPSQNAPELFRNSAARYSQELEDGVEYETEDHYDVLPSSYDLDEVVKRKAPLSTVVESSDLSADIYDYPPSNTLLHPSTQTHRDSTACHDDTYDVIPPFFPDINNDGDRDVTRNSLTKEEEEDDTYDMPKMDLTPWESDEYQMNWKDGLQLVKDGTEAHYEVNGSTVDSLRVEMLSIVSDNIDDPFNGRERLRDQSEQDDTYDYVAPLYSVDAPDRLYFNHISSPSSTYPLVPGGHETYENLPSIQDAMNVVVDQPLHRTVKSPVDQLWTKVMTTLPTSATSTDWKYSRQHNLALTLLPERNVDLSLQDALDEVHYDVLPTYSSPDIDSSQDYPATRDELLDNKVGCIKMNVCVGLTEPLQPPHTDVDQIYDVVKRCKADGMSGGKVEECHLKLPLRDDCDTSGMVDNSIQVRKEKETDEHLGEVSIKFTRNTRSFKRRDNNKRIEMILVPKVFLVSDEPVLHHTKSQRCKAAPAPVTTQLTPNFDQHTNESPPPELPLKRSSIILSEPHTSSTPGSSQTSVIRSSSFQSELHVQSHSSPSSTNQGLRHTRSLMIRGDKPPPVFPKPKIRKNCVYLGNNILSKTLHVLY